MTGIGHARNLAVVASGEAVIAVGGSWGTLAEIAFARLLGRPVVILEPGWKLEGEGVERAATPAEAVELALRLARELGEPSLEERALRRRIGELERAAVGLLRLGRRSSRRRRSARAACRRW